MKPCRVMVVFFVKSFHHSVAEIKFPICPQTIQIEFTQGKASGCLLHQNVGKVKILYKLFATQINFPICPQTLQIGFARGKRNQQKNFLVSIRCWKSQNTSNTEGRPFNFSMKSCSILLTNNTHTV